MSTRLFGYEYDNGITNNVYKDVAVAYASSNKGFRSGQGNYGLVVIPATKSGLVCSSDPLPVRLTDTVVNLTAGIDVSAFVSSNVAGTISDIDGAVTSWDNRNLPRGPSIDAFIAQNSAKSGQYLLVDASDHLYTRDVNVGGISSNIAVRNWNIDKGISSNVKSVLNTDIGISGNVKSALASSNNQIWGNKLTGVVSGSYSPTSRLTLGMFSISCMLNTPVGAIPVCMYAWDNHSSKWVPYIAT